MLRDFLRQQVSRTVSLARKRQGVPLSFPKGLPVKLAIKFDYMKHVANL